ncbi:unnamed protein product [Closterium sp. NIES-54]
MAEKGPPVGAPPAQGYPPPPVGYLPPPQGYLPPPPQGHPPPPPDQTVVVQKKDGPDAVDYCTALMTCITCCCLILVGTS